MCLAKGADDGEPSSSGSGVFRSLPGADTTANEDEEEEEFALITSVIMLSFILSSEQFCCSLDSVNGSVITESCKMGLLLPNSTP